MQSIFRLPWCSDQIAPKMAEHLGPEPTTPNSMVDFSSFAHLKRKRTSSAVDSSPISTAQLKKQRVDALPQLPPLQTSRLSKTAALPPQSSLHPYATPLPTPHDLSNLREGTSAFNLSFPSPAASAPVMTNLDVDRTTTDKPANAPDAVTSVEDDLTPLQQVIDNEFNMQILMKHNELRLIEQELAKCQVALEQLRRCEIQPYPGYDGPSSAISTGVGAAVAPPTGYTRPSHPAPYGVVDGPYTRHYRHWLLHDPQFDSIPLGCVVHYDGHASAHARSTRNNGINRRPIGRSLAMPGNSSSEATPSYPTPAPKDKSAPLVLKRSTDNQLVKLICNNCLRGNFSSIQGFLNHCRIAHKVDYKSHDAAAIDCGRVLDEQEAASLPAETASAPPPRPSVASRTVSAAPPPQKVAIHPLNAKDSSVPIFSPQRNHPGRPLKAAIPPRQASTQTLETPLKTSAQAPRLSAHFAKFNVGGNLEQAILSAKQKIDFGVEEAFSPDAMGPDSPQAVTMGGRTIAGAVNAGSLASAGIATRPQSQKGSREPGQRPRPSPLAPAPPMMNKDELVSPSEHSPVVSPHAADSNPGLVSDHEDDDHGSQSEDETPHVARARALTHTLGMRQDCTDNMEMDDVAADEDIDTNGLFIRRNSMDTAATRPQGAAKQQGNRH